MSPPNGAARNRDAARQRLRIGLAAAVLIGLTAWATVAVEHRIHAGDEHHHDGEHEDHHEEEEHRDSVALTPEQLASAGLTFAKAAGGKVVVSVELPGEIALNGEALAHVGPRVGGTVRAIKKKLGKG